MADEESINQRRRQENYSELMNLAMIYLLLDGAGRKSLRKTQISRLIVHYISNVEVVKYYDMLYLR